MDGTPCSHGTSKGHTMSIDSSRPSRIPKPKRMLLPAGLPSVDQILKLFTALTGKQPSADDRARVEQILARAHERRAGPSTPYKDAIEPR
jgi:hypothetical protein